MRVARSRREMAALTDAMHVADRNVIYTIVVSSRRLELIRKVDSPSFASDGAG